MTAHGTAVFGEAVRMAGDVLGIKLDEVRCDAEYAQTTEDVDPGRGRFRRTARPACPPAERGLVGEKTVVEITVSRRKGQTLGRTGRSSKMAGSSK
jgi:2,4-diaminopentanoate dehydrogenase